MRDLVPCARCRRHVVAGHACPFCARRATGLAVIVAASLTASACGSEKQPLPEVPTDSASAAAAAASSAASSAQPGPSAAPTAPASAAPTAAASAAPSAVASARPAANPSASPTAEPPRPVAKYGMPSPRPMMPKYGIPSPAGGGL